jgi:hypothetical protein
MRLGPPGLQTAYEKINPERPKRSLANRPPLRLRSRPGAELVGSAAAAASSMAGQHAAAEAAGEQLSR